MQTRGLSRYRGGEAGREIGRSMVEKYEGSPLVVGGRAASDRATADRPNL